MDIETNKSLVFGEFIRNMTYGIKGVITAPDKNVEGMEDIVMRYCELLG